MLISIINVAIYRLFLFANKFPFFFFYIMNILKTRFNFVNWNEVGAYVTPEVGQCS